MKLRIKNFQSHVDTDLNISKSFVCIVGSNNSGKSAIVRALQWLCYNSLRGNWFVTKGQDLCSVSWDDVSRIKSKERNAYQVGHTILDTVRNDVPSEVQSKLNISSIQIDKDNELELHVVSQKENPFLMDKPGSFKSKVINSLTGSNILDYATRDVINNLTDQKRELDSQNDFLGRVEKESLHYSSVVDEERILLEVDKKYIQYLELLERNEKLKVLKQKLEDLNKLRMKYINTVELSTINSLLDEYEHLKQEIEKVARLKILLTSKLDLYRGIELAKQRLEQLRVMWSRQGNCPLCDRPLIVGVSI